MTVKQAREAAIRRTIDDVRDCLREGATEANLQKAKAKMLDLAAQSGLFPRSDFPVPDEDRIDRNFLIHEEADGSCALYVNSSRPGQRSRPHDHGGAWAIVVAVTGEETHRIYANDGDGIRQIEKTVVRPGTAVALGPDGIHAIHATAEEPLLHLHLYGVAFRLQGERKEYDLETGTVRGFLLEDLGFIEDAR